MLEHYYKERRSVTDFRRGMLGPFFDPFTTYLQQQGYSSDYAKSILGKCCQFNAFLIDKGITRHKDLSLDLVSAFLDVYTLNATASRRYCPRMSAKRDLGVFLTFLEELEVFVPPKPKPIRQPYTWILEPYLQHLRQECELSPPTIDRARTWVSDFFEALGRKVTRGDLRKLKAEKVEQYIQQHLKDGVEQRSALGSALRRFFRYAHVHGFFSVDFSGLIPPIRRYRHASLPKGIEDSAINKALGLIDKHTSVGVRDYAIMLLMMAYGIRGVSVAELMLEDIDWPNSKIRIRAQKGGKEVSLPLMESVGNAVVAYLRIRYDKSPFREVFLTSKAPCRPLTSVVISRIIRRYLLKAGVHIPGGGSRTLRHSWAIRALAHDSPIKAIADVLGHRYIDTTFIYAKADLNTLRDVAMPWPKGK